MWTIFDTGGPFFTEQAQETMCGSEQTTRSYVARLHCFGYLNATQSTSHNGNSPTNTRHKRLLGCTGHVGTCVMLHSALLLTE
jgi:hypothetical protein